MSFKLNKTAYEKLIQEDINELNHVLPEYSLIRRHIVEVLNWSVKSEYPDDQKSNETKFAELQSTIDQQNAEIEGFREHIKETFNSKESECESLRNNLTQVMNQKIEALNEELFDKTAEYDYVMNELEEAVFLRDKFKKQIDKNNTWFDVDSKTPENHNLVLVKLKNGATTIGRVYDDGEWGIFKFQNSGVVFQKPTHWMYLPS